MEFIKCSAVLAIFPQISKNFLYREVGGIVIMKDFDMKEGPKIIVGKVKLEKSQALLRILAISWRTCFFFFIIFLI